MEGKQDQAESDMNSKIQLMTEKMDTMESRAFLENVMDEKIEAMREQLQANMDENKEEYTSMINEIHEKHLRDEDEEIGPEEQYATLK